MPALPGFTDNPLRTHADLLTSTLALLKPLIPHFSPSKSRIRIPVSTGTHFDESAAQLEGYARPIWAIGSLALLQQAQQHDLEEPMVHEIQGLLDHWKQGLAVGTDPEHVEYWGAIGDTDQRMVECEILAFGLLAAPHVFWEEQTEKTQNDIKNWLSGIRGKEMPRTNWRWFRVFSLVALANVCGVPIDDVRDEIEADLNVLEGFIIGDGWSADGEWLGQDKREEELVWKYASGKGRHADYYSGSFAIQFSQLLFCRFCGDQFPERREAFYQRARDFGTQFWRYFDVDGSAIPFGRSLAYRFACGGFFSALALAKVPDMPEPLATTGQIKGFLMRHLRWWAAKSDNIFYPDGTMNIGWTYPNTYMAEDYNSPQSVYWCLKALIVVSLPASDEFWGSTEADHPLASATPSSFPDIKLLPVPHQILCNPSRGSHHFLLSSGQFVSWPMKASQAKYCKFAYSSAFGFSIPTGPLIQQIAPDNSLALSRDNGETWTVKWKRDRTRIGTVKIDGHDVPTLVSTWYPWNDLNVEIETTLIPPCNGLSDWHIRVHRIRSKAPCTIQTVEGGFAIKRQLGVNGADSPQCHAQNEKTDNAVFVMSDVGASAVLDLSPPSIGLTNVKPAIMKPDANTNLMFPRTWIPTIERDLDIGGEEIVLRTAVFAVAGEEIGSQGAAWQRRFTGTSNQIRSVDISC